MKWKSANKCLTATGKAREQIKRDKLIKLVHTNFSCNSPLFVIIYRNLVANLQNKVFGKALNTGDSRNFGGYFIANGSYCRGVYGSGGQHDFYAANSNYGPFTGAHEVRLAKDMPGDIRPGMIISVSGRAEARKEDNGAIYLSSTLPTVALATKAMDKGVFGACWWSRKVLFPGTTGIKPKRGSASVWSTP
jgi:hypothetical protein